MNLRCYYFAAGSYILKYKVALLEVDVIKKRDVKSFTLDSNTIAEWKYTDLFCFGPISWKLKLKRCIINLQIVLLFFIYIYISVLP